MATAFPSARPSYGGTGTSDFQSQLVAASNQANTANQRRLDQAMSIYDEIIKRYQPGGTFGTAALGQLEAQKKKDVGKQTQGLISSGLYGTTTTTGLGKQWESDVGAPSRLKLEDIMMERLSGAQQNKASFIQGIQDVGPSLSDIYGMSQAGGGGGTISGGVQDTQPSGAYSAVNRGGSSTFTNRKPGAGYYGDYNSAGGTSGGSGGAGGYGQAGGDTGGGVSGFGSSGSSATITQGGETFFKADKLKEIWELYAKYRDKGGTPDERTKYGAVAQKYYELYNKLSAMGGSATLG